MVGSMTFSLCLSIIFSIFFPCLSAMRYFFWVMHVNFKLTRSSSSQKIQCVRLFVFVVLCLRPFLEHLERFFFFFLSSGGRFCNIFLWISVIFCEYLCMSLLHSNFSSVFICRSAFLVFLLAERFFAFFFLLLPQRSVIRYIIKFSFHIQ